MELRGCENSSQSLIGNSRQNSVVANPFAVTSWLKNCPDLLLRALTIVTQVLMPYSQDDLQTEKCSGETLFSFWGARRTQFYSWNFTIAEDFFFKQRGSFRVVNRLKQPIKSLKFTHTYDTCFKSIENL